MLAEPRLVISPFQSSFSEPQGFANEPEFLKKLRGKAQERFFEIGLPAAKSEDFHYINLKPLYSVKLKEATCRKYSKDEIAQYVLDECKKSYILFVNGIYQPDLSDITSIPSCVVQTTTQAAKSYGTYFTGSFTQLTKDESDPFALLNGAYFQEGAFIYIPPSKALLHPLQIVHIIDVPQESMWMMPRVHLIMGANAEAKIVSTLHAEHFEKSLFNSSIDITLDDNSKLHLIQYDFEPKDTNSWIFESARIVQKRSSRFSSTLLTESSMSRRDYKVALAGEGAEACVQGLWLLHNHNQAHVNVVIEHKEPYCHSNQLFKGVLAGSSESSFQGKILVRQKAQKTEAYQLNNNLILSDKAQANSKPGLEIFADDVKASHGATCGQLDEEELFYLKTRGIQDSDAKHLLINGFCQEIVDLITVSSLASRAIDAIHTFLEPEEIV